MKFTAKCWKFGEDVDTDQIIPARYLVTIDPAELAKHVMEDADEKFPEKVKAGDIIVAGKNFGCGSSREHAPIAIKGAGVACVIAPSFARIFYRNCFNMGLPIFECADIDQKVEEGDELEVDGEAGTIKNRRTGEVLKASPIPPFMRELIASGGLLPFMAKRKARKEAAARG